MDKEYLDYLKKQKEKTLDPARRKKWLGEEWDLKIKEFKEIFTEYKFALKDCKNALCVAARTGQEVQALQDMGINAIGIDIVPCPTLVIEGDMHNIPYPDKSFDFVYSNSFDHSLYPDKFVREMERVARKYILLQLQIGVTQDEYTATTINSSEEVIKLFNSFSVVANRQLPQPRLGMNWDLLLSK